MPMLAGRRSPRPASPSRLAALPVAAGRAPRPIPPRCCGSRSRRRKRASIRRASRDIYSNTVNEAIFERLLTYDYLARPAKLVPMVAEAMPEVTDNGRIYTFRHPQGHPFHARSGVQGRASASSSRRTSSTRSSGSWTRRTARRRRSWSKARSRAWTSSPTQAKKTGKFDYDAKIAGHGGASTATRCASGSTQTDYIFPYIVAHAAVRRGGARGDRGLRRRHRTRIRSAPGPYMLKSWSARRQDRARGQSRLPRLRLGFRSRATDAVGRGARRGDEGQEDAADRPRRDQHHRGGPVALARVQPEGARLPQPAGDVPRRRCSTRTTR